MKDILDQQVRQQKDFRYKQNQSDLKLENQLINKAKDDLETENRLKEQMKKNAREQKKMRDIMLQEA